MFLKQDAERLPIPLGYILFLGITLHLAPCAGQGASDFQLIRDSLHQHISRERRAEISCHFTYEQGGSLVSAHSAGNAAELDRLNVFIHQSLDHPELSISRIGITGYSSIEGDYAHNETLARERAEYFHTYLQVRYPELYHYPHSVAWVAEDWQGLSKLVRTSDLNEREEVLEIIRKVRVYDDREALLVKLNGGHAYYIMENTIFPQLRRVELQIEYQLTSKVETGDVDQLIYKVLEKDTVDFRDNRSLALAQAASRKSPTTSPLWGTPPRAGGELAAQPKFAIKTNALLWAGVQSDFKYTAPVANVALEYYINNNWSIEAGAMYSYLNYNSNQEFQGIAGYRLESRYNFSFLLSNRLGAYLGIYGRVGDYDRRTVDKRQTTFGVSQLTVESNHADVVNYTGKYWDAGISGGLTINLIAGVGLEIGARAGYVKTKAAYYTRENGENWFEEYKPYTKVRVTDLNMSLVYRFR